MQKLVGILKFVSMSFLSAKCKGNSLESGLGTEFFGTYRNDLRIHHLGGGRFCCELWGNQHENLLVLVQLLCSERAA